MEIIGNLIKSAIAVGSKLQNKEAPEKAQHEVLEDLLDSAKDTAFGKYYGFRQLLDQENLFEAFSKEVPYHDYDKIAKEWWNKTLEGKPDICWPGVCEYFAVSAGTTSSSKHIPVTEDMLESVRKAGMYQVLSLPNFKDLPETFFDKEILMLGSSTNLNQVGGHLEGEISGISAANIPNWFKRFYKPGLEISSIDDWDERVQRIAEEAKNWDVGSISGIPSWIELMLQRVIEYHKLETIHDIWPNLAVFTSGGVALDPYKKSFDKLFGKPVQYIDTYLASEGYLATQVRPETSSMQLICDNGIFFEFIPFEAKNMNEDGSIAADAKSITIADVEENVDYILIISTVAGAWRYMIGDTIVFTDKERAEIKITGRTKFFLNVVGSQLSVNRMDDAVSNINDNFPINIKEFTVAAVRENNEYIHHWYFGVEGDFTLINQEELKNYLDKNLQENNKNYKVARNKALKGIKISLIPADVFISWNDNKKNKGGQVKVAKVMKEEAFSEFEDFVKSAT
ncbi:GH3 auxin-responsive promoter family protein [Marivirga sp. S37H4]|uniref:GH3 auxin-responsive promoter family protein n=1 Tax=Marivirga aurantiaca TaxID=2802615 RepID=A0A934X1Z9_9BACT|nr:GH3 auxin-responsive promoter family protein [Marivirga aurantiaca]MBK6266977.1 GH3 auxin-responsive promoter family protein [Marivirga aurantiaca]